jgi:hypothetical protein
VLSCGCLQYTGTLEYTDGLMSASAIIMLFICVGVGKDGTNVNHAGRAVLFLFPSPPLVTF